MNVFNIFVLQGLVRVKEGEENLIFSHLQVKDEDTKGTKGWNAIYEIHGDKNNNFKIRTDPQTNEGLLYVNKVLFLFVLS